MMANLELSLYPDAWGFEAPQVFAASPAWRFLFLLWLDIDAAHWRRERPLVVL